MLRKLQAIAALMIALGSSAAASQPKALPAPTGPYAVGTYAVTFSDPNRRETFTTDPNDVRRLSVQVYYPAAKGCAPSTYFPSPLADVYVEELGLERGFEQRVLAHSCKDAPVASGRKTYPVVLFSHGLQHTHFSYVSIIEDLASRGNVVVAIDHSYGGRATWFPDAPLVRWDDSRWHRATDKDKYRLAGAEFFRIWGDDALRVIDRIEAGSGSLIRPALKGRLDTGRIAYLGHSYGGLSAIYATQLDTRIDGAVNMDGGIGGALIQGVQVPRYPVPVRLDVPLMILNAAQVDEENVYAEGTRRTRVRDSNHMTFSDYIWLLEHEGAAEGKSGAAAAPIRGDASIALTRELLGGFLDCVFDKRCEAVDRRLAALHAPQRKDDQN